MTRIHDDPEDFAIRALEGFAALHPRIVRPVPNGVLRATATPKGKVALVIGGGSGHYPAFLGYVGPGIADAAVAGDVFASPSTAAIARVGRLSDRGGGVVFAFGNYAGDVLNFGAAAELSAEGIDARTFAVTDDVASAELGERHKRRGVAGDVPVFKIAGAAAEEGRDIDAVMAVMEKTNARTVSIGVAFEGCTLPGAGEPLFHVKKGRMGVGLGIHGEPGIGEIDAPDAAGLADLLVEKLLPERPEGWNGRAAVILNGLGATKYEELFVLWTHIAKRLGSEGMTLVEPECGELVTSLDMAGCSLTITFLDDELETLWRAPADTAACRKGHVGDRAPAEPLAETVEAEHGFPKGNQDSRKSGELILLVLRDLREALEAAEDELGRIDAVAGDGDHGAGMRRGASAAASRAEQAVSAGAGARSVLAAAGEAWADRAGGTSGAIWGLILGGFASALSDTQRMSRGQVAAGAEAARERVMRLGGAKPGDKTLVDALVPMVEAIRRASAADADAATIWREAADAAEKAAEETKALTPKLGRARPLAERSKGHPDAGAVSLALAARTIARRLADAD
ncbi:dihydroxyacetone kinase family protein [Pararhizobium mangrovi]|uniref:Dihydroxyacetone kinase family protein n=1 Tax=Pararhizobium mangrovi TaxID=2590452 RepID=A0A506U1D1_9HYPH|nr:dihydroxyacetone kinase family protein [Pararhizobium mangrovi]TPW28162.1 dihydroxyacetone kinase family protein [Pararhizobium mangrovi]